MIYSKIILVIFFSIITPFLFGADRKTPPQDIDSANSYWLGSWGSGNSVSPSSPSQFAILTGIYSSSPSSSGLIGSLSSLANGVVNRVNSAQETFNNYWYESSALLKLGYCLPNDIATNKEKAAKELLKITNAHCQLFTTNNEENRVAFLELLHRRMGFIQKAILALPKRSDRFEIIEFLQKNHAPLLSAVEVNYLNFFTDKSAQKAIQVSGKTYIEETKKPASSHTEEDIKNILLKIGWPMSDKEKEEAAKILDQCIQVYEIKKILEKSQNYDLSQTPEGRAQLLRGEHTIIKKMIEDPFAYDSFINVRAISMRKINIPFLEKLPFHHSLLIVEHCLKHHMYVMTPFQAGNYRVFIRKQQAVASKIYDEFAQTSTLPGTDTK